MISNCDINNFNWFSTLQRRFDELVVLYGRLIWKNKLQLLVSWVYLMSSYLVIWTFAKWLCSWGKAFLGFTFYGLVLTLAVRASTICTCWTAEKVKPTHSVGKEKNLLGYLEILKINVIKITLSCYYILKWYLSCLLLDMEISSLVAKQLLLETLNYLGQQWFMYVEFLSVLLMDSSDV